MNISIESHIHMSTCQCVLHTTIMQQCLSRLLRTNTGVESTGTYIAISHSKYVYVFFCEAQARDGPQGERPQSLKPCLELTLKLVATTTQKFNFTQQMAR